MLGTKLLTKLQHKKYRDELDLYLVEGKKGVWEAISSGAEVTQLVVTELYRQSDPQLFQHPSVKHLAASGQVLRVSPAVFTELADTASPQGVLAVVRRPPVELVQLLTAPLLVVLEDIRDPGNLGTIIRTADWFGVKAVLLWGGADPYQPKVVRASMGSFFRVQLQRFSPPASGAPEWLAPVQQAGYQLVVTRPELAVSSATPFAALHQTAKLALIFGNESHGTSAALDAAATASVTIPRYGQAESLNVAVSVGILLQQWRQLGAADGQTAL